MKAQILSSCECGAYYSDVLEFPDIPSLSVVTDLKIPKVPLDPILFPGVPSGVLVHKGFRDAQARTAKSILEEVRNLFATHDINKLTLVGIYQSVLEKHHPSFYRSVTR